MTQINKSVLFGGFGWPYPDFDFDYSGKKRRAGNKSYRSLFKPNEFAAKIMTGAVRDADSRKRYDGGRDKSNIMNTGINPNITLAQAKNISPSRGEVHSLT